MTTLLWLPHRSPHHDRALVPASTALARHRSSTPGRLPLDGPCAQHAAGHGEQEDDDEDADDASHSHIASMAGASGSDHVISATA